MDRHVAVASGVGRILVWGATPRGQGAEGVGCGEGVCRGRGLGRGCAPSPENF